MYLPLEGELPVQNMRLSQETVCIFCLPEVFPISCLYMIRNPVWPSILKTQGYTTIAVHPNNASNWNRTNVYADMDFDQFISTENWGMTALTKSGILPAMKPPMIS